MNLSVRNDNLKLLLIAGLTIIVGLVINSLSPDFDRSLKAQLGEDYRFFLMAILPFAAFLLALLTTGLGKKILPGAGTAKPERYHIPPGPATRRLLDQARQADRGVSGTGYCRRISRKNGRERLEGWPDYRV